MTKMTAAQEWRTYGLLVASAMLGVAMGTIPSATLGLFMDPLHREFGWSRTEISLGMTIFAISSLPLTPLGGLLVDKFGARRVAIPGLLMSGLVFAGFGLLAGSFTQWLVTWFLYTVASIGIRTLVWNTAVSRSFSESRGLAIAVLLCGTAMAGALAPIATHALITNWGWRAAYFGLGLGWGGFALLMVVIFFRERSRAAPPQMDGQQPAAPPVIGGLTVREALRSFRMYRIAAAIFIISLMGVAVMVHLVPMLTLAGLTRAEAAAMAGVMGIASIVGKLLTGWLIDRLSGSLLPFISFAGPALGYALMLQSAGSTALLTASAIVLGYCSGAALQLATYLTTRYAGMRNFGTIFGLISTLMALSTGIGPPMAGLIFDTTGSYDNLLMLGVPMALLAGLCVFGLGAYPDFTAAAQDTQPAPRPDGALPAPAE